MSNGSVGQVWLDIKTSFNLLMQIQSEIVKLPVFTQLKALLNNLNKKLDSCYRSLFLIQLHFYDLEIAISEVLKYIKYITHEKVGAGEMKREPERIIRLMRGNLDKFQWLVWFLECAAHETVVPNVDENAKSRLLLFWEMLTHSKLSTTVEEFFEQYLFEFDVKKPNIDWMSINLKKRLALHQLREVLEVYGFPFKDVSRAFVLILASSEKDILSFSRPKIKPESDGKLLQELLKFAEKYSLSNLQVCLPNDPSDPLLYKLLSERKFLVPSVALLQSSINCYRRGDVYLLADGKVSMLNNHEGKVVEAIMRVQVVLTDDGICAVAQRDMVVIEDNRGGSREIQRWRNGEIFFEILPRVNYANGASFEFSVKDLIKIRNAMEKIMEKCNGIKFIPKTADCKDFVTINPSEDSRSNVGCKGGEQKLYLDVAPWAERLTEGIVIHELLHSIGLVHEHSRHDRRLYFTLHPEELSFRYEEKTDIDFGLLPSECSIGAYDINSIMHCDPRAHGECSSYKHLVLKPRPELKLPIDVIQSVGQRQYMSAGDISSVTSQYGHYNCKNKCTLVREPPDRRKFRCLTCWGRNSSYCICYNCASTCHSAHDWIDLGVLERFDCDCGANRHIRLCTRVSGKGKSTRQPLYFDGKVRVCRACAVVCKKVDSIKNCEIVDDICQCGEYCQINGLIAHAHAYDRLSDWSQMLPREAVGR